MMFFKRLLAYLVDCIILFFAITLVNLFIPISTEASNLSAKLTNLANDYIAGEITIDEFNDESTEINYQISKETYISTIAGIVIYILYFVVYQAYNNGQTLGKKLFKIQVVKNDDSLVDINTLLIRGLIPYGLLVNFILAVTILFINKDMYINLNGILGNIHSIIVLITLVMVMIKSRGIHDYLAKTKVEEI